MDYILYQIFKIVASILSRKLKELLLKQELCLDVGQGTFNLELLTPETKKLLGSAKKVITEYENDQNVPHLGITGV